MAQQNYYYTYTPQGPFVLQQMTNRLSANNVPISPPEGGQAMRWTQSNESNNSAKSIYAESFSTPGTSPGPVMSIAGSPPQGVPHNSVNTFSDRTEGFYDYGYYNSPAPPVDIKLESHPQTRHTPSSLGWLPNTDLVKLYKFEPRKGKEPYFELLPQWTETEECPHRVYLDLPM